MNNKLIKISSIILNISRDQDSDTTNEGFIDLSYQRWQITLKNFSKLLLFEIFTFNTIFTQIFERHPHLKKSQFITNYHLLKKIPICNIKFFFLDNYII